MPFPIKYFFNIRTRVRVYSSVPPSRLAKKCKVYGKLSFRKIIEIVATRCHILKLKCTKFNVGWSFAPDPAERVYSTSQPLAGFKGPTSKGRRKGEGGEREEKGRGREGGEREKTSECSPSSNFAPTPLLTYTQSHKGLSTMCFTKALASLNI